MGVGLVKTGIGLGFKGLEIRRKVGWVGEDWGWVRLNKAMGVWRVWGLAPSNLFYGLGCTNIGQSRAFFVVKATLFQAAKTSGRKGNP